MGRMMMMMMGRRWRDGGWVHHSGTTNDNFNSERTWQQLLFSTQNTMASSEDKSTSATMTTDDFAGYVRCPLLTCVNVEANMLFILDRWCNREACKCVERSSAMLTGCVLIYMCILFSKAKWRR